jgi:phosphoribosyl-dephospho-CoA transferase
MYPRHNLVWLSADGWRAACASAPENDVACLQRWQQEDWPAVVRRADGDAAEDEICVGIALPPDAQGCKLRVPFRIAPAAIRLMREPLELIDLLPTAPLRWQSALRALSDEIRACGLDVRVYGSLALQTLTRQPYLRDGSDIDILFHPADRRQLAQGLALLARHAQWLPLDGEVLFGGERAVAWKEWLQAAADGAHRVLVKHGRGVQLQRVDALLDAFDGPGAGKEAACKA